MENPYLIGTSFETCIRMSDGGGESRVGDIHLGALSEDQVCLLILKIIIALGCAVTDQREGYTVTVTTDCQDRTLFPFHFWIRKDGDPREVVHRFSVELPRVGLLVETRVEARNSPPNAPGIFNAQRLIKLIRGLGAHIKQSRCGFTVGVTVGNNPDITFEKGK